MKETLSPWIVKPWSIIAWLCDDGQVQLTNTLHRMDTVGGPKCLLKARRIVFFFKWPSWSLPGSFIKFEHNQSYSWHFLTNDKLKWLSTCIISTTSVLRCWACGMRDTSCRAMHNQLEWCGLSLYQPIVTVHRRLIATQTWKIKEIIINDGWW